jgi:alkanesulfonate monooxygenase SsuD/methylene tetrahydromethanopterin reductase-like flavin-dependent oxidoreductase (luciferase family)
MKYAIYLPNFGPFGNARVLAGLAQDAEKSGWDGFFLWDHIAGFQNRIVDPWVALSAIAMSTHILRIGTTVTPLPRRRPWKLARETVSVDHLSNGRLTLGVGVGGGAGEWDDLGEEKDLKTRGAMLDEALEVLSGLWSAETFTYEGRFYQLKDVCFQPPPLQQPRIPVWVGGFWPHKAPFRRGALWDGIFPLFMDVQSEKEELAQLKQAVAYVRAQRDNDTAFDVAVTGVTPGEDPDQAAAITARFAENGATWWLESIAPYRYGKGFEEPWPFEELRARILEGPPAAKE